MINKEPDSRTVRANVGERKIKPIQSKDESTSGNNNFIDWVWNGAKRLGNFICEKVGSFFQWGASIIWGVISSALVSLWNFNWNASDESIDASIKSQWNAIGGQLGGTVGNALGYLGCGFIPSVTVAVFNEPLGALMRKNVGEEFKDEFESNLASLFRTIFNVGMQSVVAWSYQNVRRFIKGNVNFFKKIFGDKAEKIINAWGAKNSKPWSFAIQVEEWVEAIPNEFLRNFVEELLEEAWEGCVEAGYVVANCIEKDFAQNALKDEVTPPWGDNLTVEITPNRNYPDEKVILQAPEPVLRGQIVDYLANDQQMRGKDIGVLYGTPPQTAIKERRFKPHIYFYFRQKASEKLPDQKSILDMEVSLRLMDKKSEDMTDFVYIDIIANKIKQKFANPVFQVKKGNMPYGYNDPTGALQTTLWVESLAEAKRVVESLLDIVGASPDWKKLKPLAPAEGGVSLIPEKISILGKVNEFPVKGRPGTVHFQESYMWLYGYDEPISLIDLTGKRKSPRVTV